MSPSSSCGRGVMSCVVVSTAGSCSISSSTGAGAWWKSDTGGAAGAAVSMARAPRSPATCSAEAAGGGEAACASGWCGWGGDGAGAGAGGSGSSSGSRTGACDTSATSSMLGPLSAAVAVARTSTTASRSGVAGRVSLRLGGYVSVRFQRSTYLARRWRRCCSWSRGGR